MNLTLFKETGFVSAVKALFKELNVPMHYITDEPTTAKEILKENYKDNATFQLIDDVYFVGMVDDAAFEGGKSISPDSITSDYDGILIFAINLHQRSGNLLPTRSQLAEISRAFNREFKYTPIVLIFKYQDNTNEYIAFANTERLKYKQEWREGEKAGKVSLLRDIDIENPHRGHLDIINQLKIPTSGTKKVDSFTKLYAYWQEVFNVNILNKKFYRELQNWYFWAIKEVKFPNAPNRFDFDTDTKYEEALKEHNGKNIIRLLTRILFIWFLKEKQLIPEEIFDEQIIANKLINDFEPQKPHGIFATGKHNSKYYRAILQNLFFATLNQEMGKRQFRKSKQHQNVTNLMRYKSYFKDPDYFIELMENIVPFMNGGLFECLDKPHPDKKGKQGGDIIIYIDGFSDKTDNILQVPDYLFFDLNESVDLSDDFGSKTKAYKNAKTRGLLEILKSYKFTITENTPIEQDVALDPELLGKVFENLLASYNPETKTTARKQTGSFYTPREIVNYMVDESLIAYLKNTITEWNLPENELDKKLHQLFSFDETNPFIDQPILQKQIIKALDKVKILDPAAGSGAFPMGALQKMVHILHKVDPENEEWKQRQIHKVNRAIEQLEEIDDAKFREQSIKELKTQIKDIEDAFENNELDYGRKLFLIENCIYGVDIQPIAIQITKLRFFISLIVNQKIDKNKANFGIRPLPNLETKFVAANTLIGIEKPKAGDFTGSLFDDIKVKNLESKLKKIRHKIFSSKSPKRKRELREEDKKLREQIATRLKNGGMDNETARLLASWDPYDQNASSPFFDPEWMFGIKDGFDIVIGNPPYIEFKKLTTKEKKPYLKFETATGKFDLYVIFMEKGLMLTKKPGGILCYINPTTFMRKDFGNGIRNYLKNKSKIIKIHDFVDLQVFEGTTNYTGVFLIENTYANEYDFEYHKYNCKKTISGRKLERELRYSFSDSIKETQVINSKSLNDLWEFISPKIRIILDLCEDGAVNLKSITNSIFQGIASGKDEVFYLQKSDIELFDIEEKCVYPILKGKDIKAFNIKWSGYFVIYPYDFNGKVLSENQFSKKFPNTYNYLLSKKDLLKGRSYFEKSTKKWYELWNQRNIQNFMKSRIVTTEISSNNNFILTDKFFGNTKTYHILLKDNNLNYFILALLNSKILEFYYQSITTPQAGGFYAYKTQFLNKIPIKNSQHFVFPISLLSKIFIYRNHIYNDLKAVLDALSFELYMTNHMKERSIDVLEFVERDINNVMQGREFEQLTDTEKEQVIEQLHQKWTSPDNEVVKRMAMFKEKSPDILKPILES